MNPVVSQFARFVVVGVVNTVIDFGVLRVLIALTGIEGGTGLIVLNSIAFIAAVTNSYLMNKYWTFTHKEGVVQPVEISKFLIVSLIGLGINDAVVYGVATLIAPPFETIGPISWIFIAKLVATGVSLVWNFIGYKFFVFNR